MLIPNSVLLDSTRITRLIQDQQTRYQATLPLRFLDRLTPVQADDDEIYGIITAKNYAAEIVNDDQSAPLNAAMVLEFVTNTIPNIKSGERLTQNLMARLIRMAVNLASTQDAAYFTDWEMATSNRLLRNVRERMNWLACAMLLDNLVYSRNGVTINASWGMPSDLNVTPAVLWTSPSATPVTDLLTLKQHAAVTYGEVFDRATLSTVDLTNAWSTTEFKQQVASLAQIAAPLPVAAFNPRDPRNTQFLSILTGIEIETDDKLMNVINPDGTQTVTRVLPLGKVSLTTKADDRNPDTMDWANAVIIESMVASLTGALGAFPAGEMYGPIAYYAPANVDMNPPQVNVFGVTRGFPRKHRKTATAVLTVQ